MEINETFLLLNVPNTPCVLEVTMRDGNEVLKYPRGAGTHTRFRSDYKGWKWIGLITCERILGNYILLKLFL